MCLVLCVLGAQSVKDVGFWWKQTSIRLNRGIIQRVLFSNFIWCINLWSISSINVSINEQVINWCSAASPAQHTHPEWNSHSGATESRLLYGWVRWGWGGGRHSKIFINICRASISMNKYTQIDIAFIFVVFTTLLFRCDSVNDVLFVIGKCDLCLCMRKLWHVFTMHLSVLCNYLF